MKNVQPDKKVAVVSLPAIIKKLLLDRISSLVRVDLWSLLARIYVPKPGSPDSDTLSAETLDATEVNLVDRCWSRSRRNKNRAALITQESDGKYLDWLRKAHPLIDP